MKFAGKGMLAACVLALCAVPFSASAEMPRSEWHNLVSDCAQNVETLKSTIAQLSAEDQAAFVAEVNDAISKLPGSDEVKAARFYAANRAAVVGAIKGNRGAVLAEIFATVPPEFLTDINERFANELFSRNANPAKTFTDEEFTALAKKTMETVVDRCQKAENGDVRATFAILMFLRSSGGTPADLAQTLAGMLPGEKARENAVNEWIKPAMGDGQEQTYDPMLGVAQAGEEPDHAVVLRIAPSQVPETLLADLRAGLLLDDKASAGAVAPSAFLAPSIAGAAQPDTGLSRVPRPAISDPNSPYYSHERGDKPDETPGSGGEPSDYPYQRR